MAADVQQMVDQFLSADPAKKTEYNFSFIPYLRKNFGFGLAEDVPVCKAYKEGHCPLGPTCPERHPTPARVTTMSTNASGIAPSVTHGSLVCKHFLKGLCKKGFKCEYLHEYNLRRMPDCQSYLRTGYCPNGDDCLYHHVRDEARRPRCEHYDRGFCPLGPICAKRHVRERLCPFYLAGFCPDGKACQHGAHPRWPENLPKPQVRLEKSTQADVDRPRAVSREEQERDEEREREWRAGRGRGGYMRYRGARGGRASVVRQ
ncbi:hypothetical protein VTN31DRAFT_3400 [Thermomyces dupontii]|uniref:uncharacterized protein n=1 Tax=Talaromyces thermophilus TaxID=28565 RepID=UPI0037422518